MNNLLIRSIISAALLLLSACSQTSLLGKSDYQKSQDSFLQGNADDAYLNFPRRAEAGSFITTLEKAYLNLIQGKAHTSSLQQQVDILENRVRYHVTREAKTFFYLQTPEDYYASEHEVIWMHFLLSWSYSLQGKYEKACIEARVSSSLLSLPWSPAGHFDDPFMRLFLAGLWSMCGNWREAQVDLRAAWMMDKSLVWARELSERDQAPANLFIILGGPGPEPSWNPELTLNPLRSSRQVSFKLRGQKNSIYMADRNKTQIPAFLSPDASKWYARHLERESELHELILDSVYGGKATASGALASTKIAAKTGLGLLVGIAGTALGAVIAGEGAKSGSDDIVRFGLITAAGSIAWGAKYTAQGYRSSVDEFKQDMDPSINYRYVRFLPEYLWMSWSDKELQFPVDINTPVSSITMKQPTLKTPSAISIGFMPDVTTFRSNWKFQRY